MRLAFARAIAARIHGTGGRWRGWSGFREMRKNTLVSTTSIMSFHGLSLRCVSVAGLDPVPLRPGIALRHDAPLLEESRSPTWGFQPPLALEQDRGA
jgi:hypothetical protein